MLVTDAGQGGVTIPEGNPGELLALAERLAGAAGRFSVLGDAGRIGDAVSAGQWEGLGYISFADSCATVGQGGRKGADACRDAAGAVKQYATALEDAIDKAEAAQKKFEAAQDEYGSAALRRGMMEVNSEDDRRTAGRLDDRITTATDDMTEATTAGTEANEAAEAAAERCARVLGEVAGRAAPLPLNAQPAAPGLVLSSTMQRSSVALRVLVFTIGGSEKALVERRADGKWAVTMADGLEGGIEADLAPGVESGGSDGTGRLGGGPDLHASALAQMENGRTYAFDSLGDAERFVAAEQAGEPPAEPYFPPNYNYAAGGSPALAWQNAKREWAWHQRQQPIATYEQGGVEATAGASGSIGGASANAASASGTKENLEDGSTTEYHKATASLSGAGSTPVAELKGVVGHESVSATTFDRQGELDSFSVSTTASGEGAYKLGPGGLGVGEGAGVRYERQTSLDASNPANRQAIQDYLRSGGLDPGANEALNERLRVDGHTDIRTYETSSTGFRQEIDAKVVGLEYEHEESKTRLGDADQRLSGSHSTTDIDLPGHDR